MESGNAEKSSAEKVLKVLEWCFVTAAFVFTGSLLANNPNWKTEHQKVPW